MNKAMQELIDCAISLQYNQQQCIDWIVIKEKIEQLLEKEKIKQETIEEAAEKYANDWEEIHPKLDAENITPIAVSKIDFIEGAKSDAAREYWYAKWHKEQDKVKCVAGCKHFTGGEVKHNKDCFHYPESLSKMYDDLKEQDKNK
jgi:hypothetical protein